MLRYAIRLAACAAAFTLLAPSSAARAATLEVDFTLSGAPLEEPTHGKFYVYEPGKREGYVGWGNGERTASFPDGTYDVVFKYRNDSIYEEKVLEEIELTGAVTQSVDFQIVPATIAVTVTSGGRTINPFTGKYSLFPAGRGGRPVASKRPGEPLVVRAGTYDIEVTVRDSRGLQTAWLRGYEVRGRVDETIEIGAAPARLRMTLLDGGRPLPSSRGEWRLFRPGSRATPVGQARSGEALTVDAGIYDVQLLLRDGRSRGSRWITGVEVRGDSSQEYEVTPESALDPGRDPETPAPDERAEATPYPAEPPRAAKGKPATVRINVRGRGSRRSDAWFAVYRPGDRARPLATAGSGQRLRIEAGNYDIGCFVEKDDARFESWLTNRRVSGDLDLTVNVAHRSASLRVTAPEGHTPWRSAKPPQVLIVFDSSANMEGSIGGATRMRAATRALRDVLAGLEPGSIEVGLRVFGIAPASQNDCNDAILMAPLAPAGRSRVPASLGLMRPAGLSPIAYSLQQAAADLKPEADNTVVLITGSADGCGGAPCQAAADLVREKGVDRVFVVGLDLRKDHERKLDCVGRYFAASSTAEVKSALEEIFEEVGAGGRGTVSVFRRGAGAWVAGGAVGEKLPLAEGTYDVLIRYDGKTYTWNGLDVRRDFSSPVAERPRQR